MDVGRGKDVGVVEGFEVVGDEGDAGEEGRFAGGAFALGDGEWGERGGADHFAVESHVFAGLSNRIWRAVHGVGLRVLGGGMRALG